MTLVEQAKSLHPEELKILVAAMEDGCRLLNANGVLYIARWYDVGWWIYRCDPGAPEYFIDSKLHSCNCPGYDGHTCKHMAALMDSLRKR